MCFLLLPLSLYKFWHSFLEACQSKVNIYKKYMHPCMLPLRQGYNFVFVMHENWPPISFPMGGVLLCWPLMHFGNDIRGRQECNFDVCWGFLKITFWFFSLFYTSEWGKAKITPMILPQRAPPKRDKTCSELMGWADCIVLIETKWQKCR